MKFKFFTLLVSLSFFGPHPVAALDPPDRISVLMASRHIRATGYNEVNPGLFLTWEGRVDLSLGAYRNSYGRNSVAVTLNYDFIETDGLRLGLIGGFAHYPIEGGLMVPSLGDLVPIGGVQIVTGNLFLQFLPMDGKPALGVLAGGVTFELH